MDINKKISLVLIARVFRVSLKKQARSGINWTTVSMLVVTAVQLAQMAILARFLDPADFGLMAVMMVVIGFSQAFQDMGISNAIIQKQAITHIQLSSLYWLNIAAGIVIGLIVLAISPLVADFYAEPRINELMALLSNVFILVAIGNLHRALCQKELDFRTMETINIAAQLLHWQLPCRWPCRGFGVMTLVIAMLTQAGWLVHFFYGWDYVTITSLHWCSAIQNCVDFTFSAFIKWVSDQLTTSVPMLINC